MDSKFFDGLFEGDSANGVKLCMGLTGGDFWARGLGCQNLYRGNSIETVDFDTIVAVSEADAMSIAIANTVEHEAGAVYLYVLRRANGCGVEERSLSAAIKAAFDDQGELIGESCNDVFDVWAEQVEGLRVRLCWYYCPVGQGSACDHFDIYWDDGSGVIDYGDAVAETDHVGSGFYSYESGVLGGGRYRFCVRAVSAGEAENSLAGEVAVEMRSQAAAGMGSLGAEVL